MHYDITMLNKMKNKNLAQLLSVVTWQELRRDILLIL